MAWTFTKEPSRRSMGFIRAEKVHRDYTLKLHSPPLVIAKQLNAKRAKEGSVFNSSPKMFRTAEQDQIF